MTPEEAAVCFAKLLGHWPKLGSSDPTDELGISRSQDWLTVMVRYPAEVGLETSRLMIETHDTFPPSIAEWQTTARQALQRWEQRPDVRALAAVKCLYCDGTGWVTHTSGEHWSYGSTTLPPRLHEATPENPILEKCACGAQRNGPREYEPPTGRDVVRVKRMIADLAEQLADTRRKIKMQGYDLAPAPQARLKRTEDIPGGPPLGEKHMTPEERQAELDAIGDRKVRRRTL